MGTLRTWQATCSTQIRGLPKFALAGVLACCFVATESRPLLAFQLKLFDGQVTGALDTRLSLGVSTRVERRNPELVGIANGGTAPSVNTDDGNLNYATGDVFSVTAKAAHELQLKWRNHEFFGRMFYFYDVAALSTDRTPLTDAAKELSVRDIRLLDAYWAGKFEAGNSPLTVKAGNQVINWGESTFIPNGINSSSPVDVALLRVAGAELREALLPVPALDVSIGLAKGLSVEAFYQVGWIKTRLEPKGTYFSSNDFISPGGTFVVAAGAGTLPDNPPIPGTIVPRASDRHPRDFGEFGVALRSFIPAMKDTELGLYYQHYHSRLPLASALRATVTGSPPTAFYFAEYPPDIDQVGASINTEIGHTGWALQGEVSYKFDQPLQVDDQELLIAGLNLCGVGGRASQLDANGAGALCGYAAGEKVTGFRRKEVLQAQAAVTKILGATLGADQFVFIGEAGLTWVPNLEDKAVLRYEGPGTLRSGHPGTAAASGTATQLDGFADDTSWGYRLLGRLVFNNAIRAVNLLPQIAFAHDVHGTTPFPLGNFVQHRKAITATLTATYLEKWEASVSYTAFTGAGSFNVLNDRDFVSTVISYAF
jgi:hypothetical protein